MKVETAKVALGNSHLLENDLPCETPKYGSTLKCDSVILVSRCQPVAVVTFLMLFPFHLISLKVHYRSIKKSQIMEFRESEDDDIDSLSRLVSIFLLIFPLAIFLFFIRSKCR